MSKSIPKEPSIIKSNWKSGKKTCEQAKAEGKKKPVKPREAKEFSPLTEAELAELPEIPEGWCWVKLGNACKKVFDGTHFSPPNYAEGDYKYITAKNIKENGLNLSNITYVTKEIHEKIFMKADVRKFDVLYIKDGVKTGIACVNYLDEQFSLLSSVGVFRTNQKQISSKYLCNYFNSSVTKERMLKNVAGVAITRLTLVKLNNSLLTLAPRKEQNIIVQEIESRLSISDNLEQTIENTLKKSETLRQSILKKAFEGKLVPPRPER